MATKRMLVDAIHPEETRIVVTAGNRIEEFDFESAQRQQLRGNIYLAKVTRVEPSLQAAFVEYGGNRHGFLAFSEIHPDYYQIPVADREALLRDEEEEHAEDAEDNISLPEGVTEPDAEADPQDTEDDSHIEQAPANSEPVESIGGADALEEVPERRRQSQSRKHYKIQEVIKRRQVMLVQVVKEERGNKGAALTTYLSLAGRYSVLMPNTARGGGISRKITNAADRKRLKEITSDLEVPQGMGVILRTAGANRTKVEVKRDFEYLMRLWENVRTLTLSSMAPCLVYEEGSLIKRSIRDLYNKDISEIVVAGEEGYREAKDFMKMLMPSHAKVVQPYRDIHPIFSRSGIEAQLDRMLQPQVTLKSGGYIIINQTEALVAVDVNSGRSTREYSIEDTALQTNLEAAEEVARQLRLRDLAGLIVIDFIDMEEKRNNRAVEKRLKDCLKNDRARIQVGRISHFGLLEMSRQRIRASVLESTTQVCPHCAGTGLVRSQSSIALHVLRGIEEYLLKATTHDITVRTPPDTALYLLNQKRATIVDYENRFGVAITIDSDPTIGAQHLAIDRGEPVENPVKIETLMQFVPEADPDDDIVYEVEEDEEEDAIDTADAPVAASAARTSEATAASSDDQAGRKRKRRRRRRNKNGQPGGETSADVGGDEDTDEDGEEGDEGDASADTSDAGDDANSDDSQKRKRRRRGKRGGRRNRTDEENAAENEAGAGEGETEAELIEDIAEAADAQEAPAQAAIEKVSNAVAPKPRRSRKAKVEVPVEPVETPLIENAVEVPVEIVEAVADNDVATDAPVVETVPQVVAPVAVAAEPAAAAPAPEAAESEKPLRANRESNVTASEPVVTSARGAESDNGEPPKPKKGGWWQKRGFF